MNKFRGAEKNIADNYKISGFLFDKNHKCKGKGRFVGLTALLP